MISDGAIRGGELHSAGPVPDESGCSIELRGQLSVDGTWIDQKLLMEGRKEEMEYMRKMGVFEVVVLRERLQAPRTEEGVGKIKSEKCRSRLVFAGDQKGQRQR